MPNMIHCLDEFNVIFSNISSVKDCMYADIFLCCVNFTDCQGEQWVTPKPMKYPYGRTKYINPLTQKHKPINTTNSQDTSCLYSCGYRGVGKSPYFQPTIRGKAKLIFWLLSLYLANTGFHFLWISIVSGTYGFNSIKFHKLTNPTNPTNQKTNEP